MRTLSFTFDAASQLTAVADPAASYAYTLDNVGRVTSDTQAITGLTFDIEYQSQYNANGRRTQLLAVLDGTADFKNTYLYDNLSRLTGLNQQDTAGGSVVADKRIDVAYNAASQYTQVTRYADISGFEFVANTFYTYDGIGRLSKLLHTEDATAPGSGWGTDPLAGYVFAYDAASRITSIDSYVDGTTTYSHDDTDQLTAADHASITDEAYSYDANGNRTMSGYDTGDNNQLTTDGTYDYEYDDEGNRSAKEKISTGEREELTWDHRNRLTKVEFKNSGGTVVKSVDFVYDAFSRLIRRTVDPDGTTGSAALVDTIFSWHADQINLQFDGPNASDLTHRNLWSDAVDQILAVEDVTSLTTAGDVKWPFSDHLGTPRDLATYNATTDDTSVSNHRIFDSYGKLISETNASFTIAIGFTGVFFEITTGLNYHRNRWLDVASGRWISEDPVGLPPDTNPYRYVKNHPNLSTDPVGLWEEPWVNNVPGVESSEPAWTSAGGWNPWSWSWAPGRHILNSLTGVNNSWWKGLELENIRKARLREAAMLNGDIKGYTANMRMGPIQAEYCTNAATTNYEVMASGGPVTMAGGLADDLAALTARRAGTGQLDEAARSLTRVPNNVTAYRAGVQLGREHLLTLGFKEAHWWVNPFEHVGGFGQGIDDVLLDADGNIWIVEYKGGKGELRGGQMNAAWVDVQINRLLGTKAGEIIGLLINKARKEGRLIPCSAFCKC